MKPKLLAILFILPFVLTSCGKYDDGPWFSIYSKAERVSGFWRFDKVVEGGVNKTEEYVQQSIELRRDGIALWAKEYSNNNPYDPVMETGNWKFRNDKENIFMTFNVGRPEEYSLDWKIKRLAYGDMRLERYDDVLGKIEWWLWKR